jgi:hypothetical protein
MQFRVGQTWWNGEKQIVFNVSGLQMDAAFDCLGIRLTPVALKLLLFVSPRFVDGFLTQHNLPLRRPIRSAIKILIET